VTPPSKSTKDMTEAELVADRRRKRKYYRNRIQNQGTCKECGGPCTKTRDHCESCSRRYWGKRVGQYRKEELLDKELENAK
jgi:hypothetical protein